MRKSILLPLLLSACTGGTEDATYRVIPDFISRSTPVACRAVELGDLAVETLRSATDSTFVVLDAAGHRVIVFGDDLQERWSVEYSDHGPGAIEDPISVALVGDTAVAVLARGGLKLVILHRGGRLVHGEKLTFVPHAIAAVGNEILITTMPLGGTPGTLLFRYRDAGLDAVPIPLRPYDDMMVGGLGNSALVETFADGSALVVHQLLAPRAFLVSGDRLRVSSLPVPTPDATAHLIGNVPRAPVTEAQFDELLLPAIDLSVDRAGAEVYLLTRSGRSADGRRERAILRTDRRLGFLAGYRLEVNAVHLAVLPRRQAAVVVDDMDRFHLCPLHETPAE